MSDKLKFERIHDMPQLKQEIMKYLFEFVSRKTPDVWWYFDGEFKYDGESYNLKCAVKTDNTMFTYKNLEISHQKEIIVDLTDPRVRGMFQ